MKAIILPSGGLSPEGEQFCDGKQDPIMHTHHVNGYGIFQRKLLITKMAAFHVVARAQLLNAKSLESLGEFSLYSTEKVGSAYDLTESNLRPEQSAAVEEWVKDVIKDQLQKGLKGRGLTR